MGEIPLLHVVVALVVHVPQRPLPGDEVGGEPVDVQPRLPQLLRHGLRLYRARRRQGLLQHQLIDRGAGDVGLHQPLRRPIYGQQLRQGDVQGPQPLVVPEFGGQLVAELVVVAALVVKLLDHHRPQGALRQIGVSPLALSQQAQYPIVRAVHRQGSGEGNEVPDHPQGGQGIAVEVEEGLVGPFVALGAPLPDVLPAGLLGPAGPRHGNPGGLPPEKARAPPARHGGDGGHQVPDKGRLAVGAHGVGDFFHQLGPGGGALALVLAPALPGGKAVHGEAHAGLRHHQILSVPGGDVVHVGGQVPQGAVPEGVVAQSDDVAVPAQPEVVVKPLPVQLVAAAVVQVDHHPGRRGLLPDGLDPCGHIAADGLPVGRSACGPQQAVGQLVAHLHHLRLHAGGPAGAQHVPCIPVDRRLQPRFIQVLPRLGRRLLAGVRPEVGVVQIQQPGHAGIFGAPGQSQHRRQVAHTRPVVVSRPVVGVVPQPQPDPVDAIAPEYGQRVLRRCAVPEQAAAALHLQQGGQVRSFDKFHRDTSLCPFL